MNSQFAICLILNQITCSPALAPNCKKLTSASTKKTSDVKGNHYRVGNSSLLSIPFYSDVCLFSIVDSAGMTRGLYVIQSIT